MATAAQADSRPMTRQELDEKIVARAWKDDKFRKDFVADPKGQFEQRLGRKLPPGLKIVVHEEDENHLHFVIPQKPANAAELSDSELESVSGGVTPISIVTAVAAVGIAVGLGFGLNSENRSAGHDHW